MHRFLLLCFFFPIYSFAYNIIFVHLGNTPPPCIFTRMKQARCFNENSDIYLLTDKNGYDFFTEFSEAFLHEEQITLINSDLIPTTPEHKTFHSVNKIEPSIYDGFWFYTSERFFVLFDFIQDRNLTDIVHLENDSMLYVDLDELNLTNLQLAAPFQSLKGCIPCFVFIKDREILSLLIRHILSEMATFQGTKAHIRLNDMQTLASFYVKFGDTYMTPLPTLIPEYSKYYSKRKSRFAPDNSTRLSFLSMNASLFPEYIFDAAGLGIFLNGNDRKRSPHSGPGTIHSRSLFDPSVFSFFWKPDTMKRVVPYLSFKGKEYRIANLHFHSKMPENYTSFNPKYFIAIKKNEGDVLGTLDTYIPFTPPENRFYADPFLLKKDETNYLFFENYDYKKGVISYVTLDPNGSISKPELALELPTHLSFPYVFYDNDEIYMIPETYRYQSVSLYKSIEFPNKWSRERVLVKGEKFSDPILFKHNEYYWLFTAIHMDQLQIYYAKDLHSPFLPHPINRKRIKGRNAGSVYYENNRLIRPTMDCSKGYGRSMTLKEILLLTPSDFLEKEIAHIEPTWSNNLTGTHTYSQNEDFVVYDGQHH